MLPVVAIVGRPNVGKSTLFNRLVGERKALVDDRPGVTRDRNYGTATSGEREVFVIDTGGLEPEPVDDLFDAIRLQVEAAISEADVVLFVVDRQTGLTPADKVAADLMRRLVAPPGSDAPSRLLLVVNKCDGPRHEDDAVEFWQLGFDPLLCISAEHGRGIYDLWEAIEERLPEAQPEEDEGDDAEGEIRIAVIGRPNIGKSTLVNRLIGEDRHVVHDAPGTTMDAIDSVIAGPEGRTYRIVDTAGVRRKARIEDRLETFATLRAIKTIERCHVTLLLIDAVEGVSSQDAKLAGLIADRGRAVIVLMNRWDLMREIEDRDVHVVDDELERKLPHLRWAPTLYISALTGKGCHRILSLVETVYQEFNRRIGTGPLNRFLVDAVEAHSPPQKHHHPVRINYVTQARVRPPSFVFWSNSPDAIPTSYKRYLENKLRENFGFHGTPIRLQFRMKRKPGEPKEPAR